MNTRERELKNSIEDLRNKLDKFERELKEINTVKVGDIVRIVSTNPVPFATDSPFVVGAYCEVISIRDFRDRISIKLPKGMYYSSNVCKESQVEVVWSK